MLLQTNLMNVMKYFLLYQENIMLGMISIGKQYIENNLAVKPL
jgi:hypothetical protein